jgi:hypothetical protein
MTDIQTERRKLLIATLRALPPDHRWDFQDAGGVNSCGSHGCAFAVMDRLWPIHNGGYYDFIGVPQNIGASIFGADGSLFVNFSQFYKCHPSEVTPGMVADALERVP